MGSRKGVQSVSGVHVLGPNLTDHLLWDLDYIIFIDNFGKWVSLCVFFLNPRT